MREYKNFCNKFSEVFVSGQTFRNFTELNASFFSGLSGERKGFVALSESSTSSYESIQYLMTDAKWSPDEFNKARVDLLQQNTKLAMKHNGSISIDDTEQLHYGSDGKYVDYQYSSTLGKTVKSTKFVNLHYHDDKKNYHISLEPYQINKNVSLSLASANCPTIESFAAKISDNDYSQKTIINHMKTNQLSELCLDELFKLVCDLNLSQKIKRKIISKFKRFSPDFESKIDLAIKGIQQFSSCYGASGKLFISDSWYATVDVIKTVIGVGASYLMRLKDNRIIELQNGDKVSVKGLVTSQAEAFVSLNETTKGFYAKINLPSIGQAIFVVLREENCDRSFITNLLPAEEEPKRFLELILKHVKSHWIIEEGHKKLNVLGLDKYCGAATESGLKKHIAMVLFRYTFLVYLSVKERWRNFVSKIQSSGKSVLNNIYKLINLCFLQERTNLKVENILQDSVFSEVFA